MAHHAQRCTVTRTSSLLGSLVCALIGAAGTATPAAAGIWSWNAGSGNWMTAGNWSPNSVPGINHLVENDIRIGNLPGVQNSTVFMNNATGGGSLSFDQLSLSDGMTLDMSGRALGGLAGTANLTDENTRLIVRSSTGFNFHDFTAASMTLNPGTNLQMADGGRLRTSMLNSYGLISGSGTLHLQGGGPGASLHNHGTIYGSGNGGLTLIQENAGRLNLDGTGVEGPELGQLSLVSPFSVLTFQGDQLMDFFSGTVTMGSGSLLNMEMSTGWTADGDSTFYVSSSVAGAAAQIDGGHFTFGGNLNIGGTHGHLRVLADATLLGAAEVFLGTDDRLEFNGDTTVEGGLYNLSQGGRIDFNGATEIGGGTFNMVGNLTSQGVVNLNGSTQWGGITTINGLARQVGSATVSTPTTINANIFDMDGNNNAAWAINHSLNVNTQSIESGSQQFDGTVNMNVGALGRLTVNLANPAAAWTMNGTMNIAGFAALITTRVAGSEMIVRGDLNMGSGIAQISAPASFQGGNISIAHNGTLRMRSASIIDAATTFSNSGTLQNGIDGSMMLETGVSLNQVGLVNDSVLRIGQSGPGIASVDRFSSTSTAVLSIDLGGYIAGSQHDVLLVTGGGATLGGSLDVGLIAIGAGEVFAPSIGDEFTVISALGGVSGTFANDPTSQVDNLMYEWTVIYNPNTVVMRLENIVRIPECGCAADYNQDGGINGEDVEAFFIDFENGTGCSDVNQDGGINGEDVEAFFLVFENGGC